MKKIFSKLTYAFVLCLSIFFMSSCDSDNDVPIIPNEEVKKFLTDDMVLYTKAELNGVDKTILPTGCPTIFNFDWINKVDKNNNAENIVKISMVDFQVGNMPMKVSFECDAQIVSLNQWENDEYKGEGWMKLQGLKNGCISMGGNQNWQPTEGDITGYYNIHTHQIKCIIDFNFMGVKADIIKQEIDKSNLAKFSELRKKFDEDLKKYKEEHGLK